MTIHERIYRKLEQLGVVAAVERGDTATISKLDQAAMMDLHLEVLEKSGDRIRISLAHYFEQNGDLCADPDMEIAIVPKMKAAEALTFQQAIPPIMQVVYPAPGKVVPQLKSQLNQFLLQWLANCISQGHRFRAPDLLEQTP